MTGKLPQKKALPASWISFTLIVLTLTGLAFLPDYFRRTHFAYQLPPSDTVPAKQFPLETPLPLVEPPQAKEKLTSVKNLMAGNPNGAIVNLWATWCPPCLEELPGLEYLNRELKTNQASLPVLVTISVDNAAQDVVSLYKTLDFTPTFTVLHDKEGQLSRSIGTTKFPETYWVGADGNILHKWIGPQNWLSKEVVQKLVSLTKR